MQPQPTRFGHPWTRRWAGLVATLAALLAAPSLAWTQAPESDLPFDPEALTGTLSNGLTYYVKENSEPRNRAQLRLAVHAGSVLEEEHERGLAHYLEHMAFNGSERFSGNEIVEYLESIGSKFGPDLNAYTSFDETVYKIEIPTDDPEITETAFEILSDWAYAITLDPEEVEKERGVVLEEWRTRRGAAARIRDLQYPVLFGDSRYSVAAADRPAGGDRGRHSRRPARLLRALVPARPDGGDCRR